MVTPEMIAAAEAVPIMCGTYGIAAEDAVAIYLAMHAARPTADLGEDGEKRLAEIRHWFFQTLTLDQRRGFFAAWCGVPKEIEFSTGLQFQALDHTARAVLSRSGG